MRKIRGAVEWINVPLVFAASLDARSFFTHYIVSWKLLANSLENQRFRLPVGDRHQINVAFVFDLHMLTKMFHQQSARLSSHSLHRRNEVERLSSAHATFTLSEI